MDDDSGAPLAQASVRILADDGRTLVSELTGADGRYSLEAPAGTYVLEAGRIGYRAEERELVLEAGESVTVDFRLAPAPVELDPLTVAGIRAARPPRCEQQVVFGRVVDAGTSQPLAEATVRLLGAGERELAAASAGSEGDFALATPGPGVYRLRAESEGYEAAVGGELRTLPGDTIAVELSLASDRALASPMVITGSTRPWTDRSLVVAGDRFYSWMDGCQEERPSGPRFGEFVDRASIAEWEGHGQRLVVGSMLQREVPAVSAVSPEGHVILAGRCVPNLYLDGIRVNRAAWDRVSPETLEAVEVYEAPHVPRTYWRLNRQPCGVVAMWTRGGER